MVNNNNKDNDANNDNNSNKTQQYTWIQSQTFCIWLQLDVEVICKDEML